MICGVVVFLGWLFFLGGGGGGLLICESLLYTYFAFLINNYFVEGRLLYSFPIMLTVTASASLDKISDALLKRDYTVIMLSATASAALDKITDSLLKED